MKKVLIKITIKFKRKVSEAKLTSKTPQIPAHSWKDDSFHKAHTAVQASDVHVVFPKYTVSGQRH